MKHCIVELAKSSGGQYSIPWHHPSLQSPHGLHFAAASYGAVKTSAWKWLTGGPRPTFDIRLWLVTHVHLRTGYATT